MKPAIYESLEKIDQILQASVNLSKESLIAHKKLAAEKQCSLLEILYQSKIITEKELLFVNEQAFLKKKTQLHDFDQEKIDWSIISLNEIKHLNIIPEIKGNDIVLLTYDLSNLNAHHLIQLRTKKTILYQLIGISELKNLIHLIEVGHIKTSHQSNTKTISNTNHLINQNNEDDLVQLINVIILSAIEKNASDIHFEPYKNHYRVRIRNNDLLEKLKVSDHPIDRRITGRLKVMANLDISESRLPQDGQISIDHQNESYSIRVSTCPTLYGEKIVLRILYRQKRIHLSQIGMSDSNLSLFSDFLKKQQGLILICGPTGSGKTTTLYAALEHLNQAEKNILTIEDPVEINLDGINQVNVNTAIGLTFDLALVHFLRQDPDIMLIGEIRDERTAQLAIKAAQTGHLVLASLHSSSATKAITRLQGMNIPNHDIIDTISLIVSQRLIRLLCPFCKKERFIGKNDFNLEQDTIIYEEESCKKCQSGYKEKKAIYEILEINDEISHLILEKKSSIEINRFIKHNQNKLIEDQAVDLLKNGLTSINEMMRVL